MTRIIRAGALASALFICVPVSVWAQPDLSSWFTPTLGHAPYRADFRSTWYPDERVPGQATKLGYSQEDFSAAFPLWQCPNDEWTASVNVRSELFNTAAIIPGTGEPFPSQLWNIHMGTSYRHLFENGWITGGNVTFGSASDEPFHSINEMIVGGTAYLRVPQGEHNAWLFSLNYSTNREFLNGIPIPGIAYFYAPTEWFQATIGVPFASVTLRPIEDLTLTLSYAPLTNVHAKALYRLCGPLRVYAGFDFGPETYLLAERRDDRDHFFYYEQRLTSGFKINLDERIALDLSGGYGFNRYYFEAIDFQHSHDHRVDVQDGPFASFQVLVKF